MDIAVKAQTFRGRVAKVDENIDYIWDRIKGREEQYSYRINRDSKIFELLKGRVDDETWTYFDMILEEIEKSLPYQQIYIDKSQNKVNEEFDQEELNDIKSKAEMLISMAIAVGNSDYKAIIDNLFLSEPFCKCPSLKEQLMEDYL